MSPVEARHLRLCAALRGFESDRRRSVVERRDPAIVQHLPAVDEDVPHVRQWAHASEARDYGPAALSA